MGLPSDSGHWEMTWYLHCKALEGMELVEICFPRKETGIKGAASFRNPVPEVKRTNAIKTDQIQQVRKTFTWFAVLPLSQCGGGTCSVRRVWLCLQSPA